jgi:hypothetical protein
VLLRVAKDKAKPTPETLLDVRGLVALGERGDTTVDNLSM